MNSSDPMFVDNLTAFAKLDFLSVLSPTRWMAKWRSLLLMLHISDNYHKRDQEVNPKFLGLYLSCQIV